MSAGGELLALFSKKERENTRPGSITPAQPAREERSPAPSSGRGKPEAGAVTTIGPALRIKGEMTGDEDVTVEGRVEGILSLAASLLVAKTGVVEADIRARTVTVHGRIVGNVHGEQRVEILQSGQLEGNIKSPKISIHEGAHFKGNVDMNVGAADDGAAGSAEIRTSESSRPKP